MEQLNLMVTDEVSGERLDKAIPKIYPELSRNAVQQLVSDELVWINGSVCNKKTTVRVGDVISIEIPEPKNLSVDPENIPLDIVYEDDHLLVVNKPKGMVVHPAAGNYSGTLVNALHAVHGVHHFRILIWNMLPGRKS